MRAFPVHDDWTTCGWQSGPSRRRGPLLARSDECGDREADAARVGMRPEAYAAAQEGVPQEPIAFRITAATLIGVEALSREVGDKR
jgi:hypothetical protein